MDARHTYEKDTKATMSNLRKVDNYLGRKTGLTNSTMENANNKKVAGASMSSELFRSFSEQNIKNNVINSFADRSFIGGIVKEELDKKEGSENE